ncbi:MAG: type III pantothenate kinase [Lentisphaeria bacterium]
MRYLLNIGNTHTQLGAQNGSDVKLLETWNSPALTEGVLTACLQDYIPEHEIRVACVVPQLRKELEQRYNKNIYFVSEKSYPQIDFSHYDTRTLGADRIANAGAAYAFYGGPVMVIDCGTAITTEIITKDGKFLGGAILPGRQMLRRALHMFTAQLPEVPMRSNKPSVIGNSTTQAIFAGVDLGVLGAIKEIIQSAQKIPALQNCKMITVGGDASYFTEHIEHLQMGQKYLTLQGLAIMEIA